MVKPVYLTCKTTIMKKIIAAVDAFNFTEQELKNYKYLADKAGGQLTILFLENIAGESILFFAGHEGMYVESIKSRQERAGVNRQRLVDYYRDNCMDVTVRSLPGVPEIQVLEESRYADLLLIRSVTSFNVLPDTNPPQFIRELLAEAQCPVMIVPDTLHYIQEVVFTYNGTFSSMFAIRQFTQVFNALGETPVKVVYVLENGHKQIPNGKLLKDYLTHHYDRITFQSFEGTPVKKLAELTLEQTNGVITFGAYGRSRASRFFHPSDADSFLRTTDIPVFITHP